MLISGGTLEKSEANIATPTIDNSVALALAITIQNNQLDVKSGVRGDTTTVEWMPT